MRVADTITASCLYVGRVGHRRLRPRTHQLSYRVFWMLLDLDEIDLVANRLRVLSRNRFNFFGFRDRDYGDRSGRPLRAQIGETLAAAGLDRVDGPIRLLTMPRILGYAFNPISTYFCHGEDGALRAIVYEVHNTFDEIHSYVVPVSGCDAPLRQQAAKAFHVSPFMGLDMQYDFSVVPPGQTVTIGVNGSDADGLIIATHLTGERRELSDSVLLGLLASHPLLTLKVTAAIHWHALRLLMKRIPFFAHPAPPQSQTTRGRPLARSEPSPMVQP